MALQEGQTTFAGRITGKGEGPGSKDADAPFYNPAMALNRDLSVLTVATEAERRGRDIDVADALCGAGARSLRLAAEVPHEVNVWANDRRADAVALVRKQADKARDGSQVVVQQGDAEAFLASRKFDVVDIDPYGSPMPFLDHALRATRHNGLLCLTATDTAALSGRYPRVTRRRYGAWHGLHKHPWRAEVGLRLLLGAAARGAGRLERGIEPVWSLSAGHWMRVVVRVKDGTSAAERSARMQNVIVDERGMGQWTHDAIGQEWAGPCWTGQLHDDTVIARMQHYLEACPPHTKKATSLLEIMAEEAAPDCPPFWLDLDDFAGTRSGNTPRTADARAALQAEGFEARRSHMATKGIRTNAELADLEGMISTAKPV